MIIEGKEKNRKERKEGRKEKKLLIHLNLPRSRHISQRMYRKSST
jgi:hypothetical protein